MPPPICQRKQTRIIKVFSRKGFSPVDHNGNDYTEHVTLRGESADDELALFQCGPRQSINEANVAFNHRVLIFGEKKL